MSQIHSIPVLIRVQGPVVRKVDKSFHWISMSKIQCKVPLGLLIFSSLIVIHRLNNRGQKHTHVPKHDCWHVKSREDFLLVSIDGLSKLEMK